MIVQHSHILLQQLSELERKISQLEEYAQRAGLPLESEDLLRLIWQQHVKGAKETP